MKFTLIIFELLSLLIIQPLNGQVISFNMRKIAYSTNQFGLDLLRASDKNERKPIAFCPFCISSSLVMLLMGSQNEMANSLRHALYLNPMSENEINFAYFDMINHLGVNMPTQKQLSTLATAANNQLNHFKTPVTSGGSGSGLNIYTTNSNQNSNNNLDLLNKAGLLASSESHQLTLIPNNYLTNQQQQQHQSNNLLQYNNQLNSIDTFKNQNYDSSNQLFPSYEYSNNKLNNPFSPYNEHRNNFIKFSQQNDYQFKTPMNSMNSLNSNINNDIKTSNYLFGRSIDSKRITRAFGFGKNSFWNSKSYLNPFGTMLNAFQNNFQNQLQQYPANYQPNNLQPGQDMVVEKFGQNVNHQALNNVNNIKLPNHFHYYNKHMMSNKPTNNQENQQLTTINSNLTTISSNKKSTSSTILSSSSSMFTSSSSSSTTESPKPQTYPTTHNFNHHHSFNPAHYHVHNQPNNLDNSLNNHYSVRLGTNHHHHHSDNYYPNHQNDLNSSGNDISFLTNIYVQRDFVINYHYQILLQKFYKTAIHPLDFIHNGEETRQHINSYIDMQTDNKICNILPERQSPSTQLLLINALYFKGELDLKLNLTKANQNIDKTTTDIHYHNPTSNNNSSTKNKEQLSRNQESNDQFNPNDEIWMEASKTRLRYAFDNYLNCSTVEMPFKDSMITLVVMIPSDKDGLETLLTKLNAQMINDVINSLEIKRVTIKLPRINIENSFNNLSMTLANLGLSNLFRPGHSQLTNISDFKWLYVTDIIHKTHLNIKENSAANNNQQPIMKSKSRTKQDDQTDVINIELNKPFLFFIMDSVSGLIMSMGKFDKEAISYRLPSSN